MTYAPEQAPSLGVGHVLSQSLSILVRRLPLLFGLALVVQLLSAAVSRLLLPDFSGAATGGAFPVTEFSLFFVTSLLISVFAGALTTGILVLAAYDTRLGNPPRLGAYFGAAAGALLPLVVVTLLYSLGVGFGFVLLIVPGLVLMTVWAVYVPAIVVEDARYGGLSRSRELTRGYRWPVFALLAIVGIAGAVLGFLITSAAASLFEPTATALVTDPFQAQFQAQFSWSQLIAQAIATALATAFSAVLSAVLFARLKEIKEGVGMESIADVFD